MSPLRRWTLVSVLLAGTCGALSGCGLLRKKTVPRENRVLKEMREGTRPMGSVTVLNEQSQFLLVKSPIQSAVAEKQQLVTKNDAGERTGKIIVSPERKRTFIAADIVEGSPRKGDLVYFPTDKKPVSTALATEAEVAAGEMSAGTVSEPAAAPAAPATLRQEDLPPLGQPSGPVEDLPELPDAPSSR